MNSNTSENRSTWLGHLPVLADEVVRVLEPSDGKIFFDGTIGGGGHAELMLQRGVFLFGTDRDKEALREASRRLARFSDMFELRHEPYDETFLNESSLDGILIDLGVSSHQLESASRGFSFQKDGPLDMRMDTSRGQTAAEYLAQSSDSELTQILLDMEDSPRMRATAKALLAERRKRRFETTAQLAAWAEQFEGPRRRRTHHPATLIFQALRIAVNNELERLERFLEAAPRYLKPCGVLAVITFHSIEDRIVKRFFESITRHFLDTPEWPNTVPNPKQCAELITKKAIAPGDDELRQNPRARSAKLRAVRKLPHKNKEKKS